MKASVGRCFAGLALLMSVATAGVSVRAIDHQGATSYRCRFERTTGYFKFSPFKPAGRRLWTFALELDHESRRVAFMADGKSTMAPAIFRENAVDFTIPVEGRNERVSFDVKDLDFLMEADTRKARLLYLGQCEKVGA